MTKPPSLTRIRRILAATVILAILGLNAAKLLQGKPLTESDLISIPIALITFFNVFTWNSSEEERDEMGVSIATESASLSYYAMLVVLLLLFLIGEWRERGSGSIDHELLFAALCVGMVLQPCIEWWMARKYR
ncbi:hypothetical protein [Paenibacillus mucilaginosus]|uniref:Uncharacterized protein n=1 Tax=Paenibacillus mucilaginosus (strain KNP414) TaxID=1036673 RepID=F8F8K1_PAEMK|nr:hypothetical protein [Paenibacillus mucilaginosus]AEI41589.1 hypothetical protein KNP414_03031 [Paenibacillus mucilaginosus KNP414]MCG7215383.1 hypothetical protein [Paenibacillus mucilaginosus]WDM30582.1 hypothetical protein KCX80_16140 [Paenibacillus mucilaginosus]